MAIQLCMNPVTATVFTQCSSAAQHTAGFLNCFTLLTVWEVRAVFGGRAGTASQSGAQAQAVLPPLHATNCTAGALGHLSSLNP